MSQTSFQKLTLEEFATLTKGLYVMSFEGMYEYASEHVTYRGRRGLDWNRYGPSYSATYMEDLKRRHNDDNSFEGFFEILSRHHLAEVKSLILAEIVRQGVDTRIVSFARRSQRAPVEVIPAEAWHVLQPDYEKQALWYDEDTAFIDTRFVSTELLPNDHPMFQSPARLGSSEGETVRSPGRPSAQTLVTTEFERRMAQGLMEAKVSAEAKALSDWLLQEHPTAPPMSPKTIENHIRTSFRNRPLK